MRREGRGPSRRERRAAAKGEPTGRRSTHRVLTSYGRHQKERDRVARFTEMMRKLSGGGVS